MCRVVVAVLWLVIPSAVHAQEWSVSSPDSRNVVTMALEDAGKLSWRVDRDGSSILGRSPIGIRRHDQTFSDGLKFMAASEMQTIDERYHTPHGKRRDHHVAGRERTLTFTNARNAKLEIVLRAHNDGVAIRYRFPETDPQARRVFEEMTGFAVPAGSTGWMLPHQRVHQLRPRLRGLLSGSCCRAKTRPLRLDGHFRRSSILRPANGC